MFQAIIMAASILALGETGRETLSGSLEGRELSLRVAGSGVTCRGDLVELSPGMGQGVLSCTDRREGTFHWRIERGEGTGYGRLGSEDLVITFG